MTVDGLLACGYVKIHCAQLIGQVILLQFFAFLVNKEMIDHTISMVNSISATKVEMH